MERESHRKRCFSSKDLPRRDSSRWSDARRFKTCVRALSEHSRARRSDVALYSTTSTQSIMGCCSSTAKHAPDAVPRRLRDCEPTRPDAVRKKTCLKQRLSRDTREKTPPTHVPTHPMGTIELSFVDCRGMATQFRIKCTACGHDTEAFGMSMPTGKPITCAACGICAVAAYRGIAY